MTDDGAIIQPKSQQEMKSTNESANSQKGSANSQDADGTQKPTILGNTLQASKEKLNETVKKIKEILNSTKTFVSECNFNVSDAVILTQKGIVKDSREQYKLNETYKEARFDADNKERKEIRADFMKSLGIPTIVIFGFLFLVSIVYPIKFADKKKTETPGAQTMPGVPSMPNKTMFDYTKDSRGRAYALALLAGVCGVISLWAIYFFRRAKMGWSLLGYMFGVFMLLFMIYIAQESSGLNRFLDKSETQKGNSIYYDLAVETGEPVNIASEEEDASNEDPFLVSLIYIIIVILLIVFVLISAKLIKSAICGFRLNPPDITVMCRLNMTDITRKRLVWFFFVIEIILICGINSVPIFAASTIRNDKTKSKVKNSSWILIILIALGHMMFQFAGAMPHPERSDDCTEQKNYSDGSITQNDSASTL
jgi:hypothetical protein